jgi:hypothetical protein
MKGNNKRVIYWFQKLIRHIMSKNALLNCHFQVEWAGTRIGFIEVKGITIE